MALKAGLQINCPGNIFADSAKCHQRKLLQIYKILIQHLFLQLFFYKLWQLFLQMVVADQLFAKCCSQLLFCNFLFQRIYLLQFNVPDWFLLSPSSPILGQNWKHDLARPCFIRKNLCCRFLTLKQVFFSMKLTNKFGGSVKDAVTLRIAKWYSICQIRPGECLV